MNGPSRRWFLGGGLLLVGGTLVAHAVGHRPMEERASAFLGSAGRTTLEAVLEALLPDGAPVSEVADGIEGFLAQGDPIQGGQLGLALTVLEHTGGASPWSISRFSRRSVDERRRILEAWRSSSLGTRRQIADAMRRVALFSWYTREQTWAAIGYDGPWVRP
ncbi:MAG: hypothetical protein KC621_32370 [Myxococcales bacterium]|nr:hypothetical protein [Myxococcales bacterium]